MKTSKEVESAITFLKKNKGEFTRVELAERFNVPYQTLAKAIKRKNLVEYVSSNRTQTHSRGGEMGEVKEHKLKLKYPITKEINFKDLPVQEKFLYATLFNVNNEKLRYKNMYVNYDDTTKSWISRVKKRKTFLSSNDCRNIRRSIYSHQTKYLTFKKRIEKKLKLTQLELNWVNEIGNLDGK